MPELVRDLIGTMVNDVLAETRATRVCRRERSRCRRRSSASPQACAAEERALKAFLHARMYDAPSVQAVREEAQTMLARLFEAYRADPALLPAEWRPDTDDRIAVLRAIGDFIAGMTDRYAVRRYEELVGPTALGARI